MLSVLFVFLTLALVMFLVFKKVNIVIASLTAAILLALLDRQDVLTAMTDTFMTGASNYIKNFFLLFFVSALFGKVMESTGAAAAIARGLANLLGENSPFWACCSPVWSYAMGVSPPLSLHLPCILWLWPSLSGPIYPAA